jgi:hypothetical protein
MNRVIGVSTGAITGVLGFVWIQSFQQNKEKELERQEEHKNKKRAEKDTATAVVVSK